MEGKTAATEKVTVTITTADGTQNTLSGDTVIAFTVSDIAKIMSGESNCTKNDIALVGGKIPQQFFAAIFGKMICKITETVYKDLPGLAAFELHEISGYLEGHSNELINSLSVEDLNNTTIYLLGSMMKDLFM